MRQILPSDVSDEEWAFVAPYLSLMRENAPQREHDLRDLFNALPYQEATGGSVEVGYVDQGCTGEADEEAAKGLLLSHLPMTSS